MSIPKRILILGILFILAGILAVWEVVSDLMNSHLNLNFAVFLLPVGIGLLKGKRSSRSWAKFWIILGYLLCGLLSVLAMVAPGNAHAYWPGHEVRGPAAVPYVLLFAALLALFLMVMQMLLRSDKANAYFNHAGGSDGPHST